jgi:hypothetical protein
MTYSYSLTKPRYTKRTLEKLGFDAVWISKGRYRIRCTQCQSATINGTPCHERGCPNTPRREED